VATGEKELLAVNDGVRESEQSWREVLLDLKDSGLEKDPELAVGDGALGFWKALPMDFPTTRIQRCWVHKTANVLNALPKGQLPEAKSRLQAIWMAATRGGAFKAFDLFVEMYGAKYSGAAERLTKDRSALLAFYDFPAEDWLHIRTTNPIKSTFATVHLRTIRTKGCGTRRATLTMVFKFAQAAERRRRRLTGSKLLVDVILGGRFVDGIKAAACSPQGSRPQDLETPPPPASGYAPKMAIQIGTRVRHGAEEYVLTDLLNSGGFGDAFLANRVTPSAKEVVVKVPRATVLADPIWSKKFEREARILANIKHRNVVKIVAFWAFSSGDMALVQERVVGAQHLPAYLKVHPDHAPSLFLQTMIALRAFHALSTPSIVHRDLSPNNILVDASGIVKVIDFGLAKEDPRMTQVLTEKGVPFGTLGCMAPEQIADPAAVDHRADLFAAGRTFTAALQGRSPQHADPSGLPEPWRSICTRLVEYDAAARYQSAEDALSDAMHRFAAAGTQINNFPFLAEELGHAQVIPGWPELCSRYFLDLPDITQVDLALAAECQGSAFGAGFNANAFFDAVEGSKAISDFEQPFVPFEDADPVGKLYRKLFPHLDSGRKRACFRRLCAVAVRCHRFFVMDCVRVAFEKETDDGLKADLLKIANEEDPDRDIWHLPR
jgi:serine/threonine protein kinase